MIAYSKLYKLLPDLATLFSFHLTTCTVWEFQEHLPE